MGENYIMEEYKQKLPSIFRQILMKFKDAPTCNSWVLEKLMEVFCKDIAHNIDLVKAVDFKSFLDGFLEADGDTIMYPDFVMNNVSLMAAEVLSAQNDCSFLEKSAFSIIRSPLYYWMVSRGHRVDVTFQIYKRWVQQRSLLHLLDAVQFDVSQALIYCLASPHNYTRQSAGDYFTELIKLTHNEPQEEEESEVLSNIKSRLKPAIYQLIQEFSSKFIKHAEVTLAGSSIVDSCVAAEKFPNYNLRAAANYCKLLSQCAATSDVFCRNCAKADMFDELVAILQILVSANHADTTDVLRPCTVMLMRLINYSDLQKFKVEKLIKLLLRVCKTDNSSMACDAVYMAGLILTQCDVQAQDQTLLLELSLLPLFLVFDVTPQAAPSTCPAAVTIMKSLLKVKQTSKSSSLLRVAVDNLSVLADFQISETCYNNFIDYLELKSIDLPRKVGLPMLNEGKIRNETCLNFLVLKLTNINLAFNKLTDAKCCSVCTQTGLLNNIQSYTLACVKFPGISCGQLSTVLNCYLTILKYVKNAEQCKNSDHSETAKDMELCCNRQILQDILQILQFKMLDRDPNVREMAVKITGELFFVVSHGSSAPEAFVDMHACLPSLWQCVDNKTEGVAMNVLEFLLKAAKFGQLDTVLSLISVTKADLITRIDTFLLSSVWDDIKPVAFNLLTKVCPLDLLVKYAEACLRQDNVRLALVVLDYIQHMFSLDTSDDSLEQKIDTMSSLLLQGWGDLILQKANASDVCSFRKASSIITMILCFLEQQDVCSIIDKRVSNFCSSIGIVKENCERSHVQFLQICNKIFLAYDCSKTTTHTLSDEQEHDIDSRKFEHDDKGTTLDRVQRFDSTAKEDYRYSFLCSLFTLIDVDKIPSAERDLTQNRDMLENHKMSGNELTESVQDKMLSSEFDFYVDSTKEMPALSLRTEAFTSQKQIQDILPHSDVCPGYSLPSATGLLSWFVFQEIFRRIEPGSLQQEAQRSTDEYERNSLTLLCDLEQVLKRIYFSLQDQLEKELTEHLFSTFSSLLNTVLTEADFKKQDALKKIVECMHIITLLQDEEDGIITFMLQKRKSVLKAPFENGENVCLLDLFLERMNVLNVQGSKAYVRELFASVDGLKTLLQLYIKERKTHDSFMIPNTSTQYVTTDNENQDLSVSTHKIIDILHNMYSDLSKSDVLECLSCLKADELYFLSNVLDSQLEDWETIQSHLKTLLNSFSRQMFLPVMQVLRSLTKQLVVVVFEGKSQIRAERCSNIGACFNQLENWYVAEDSEFDSDGDDDPTAVDCY